MGPECLALTVSSVCSVSPAGQQGSGSSQLLRAAASALSAEMGGGGWVEKRWGV